MKYLMDLIWGVLSQIGDSMSARVTDSGRKVMKVNKDNGNFRYSRTEYSNGTSVETKVVKKKR